MELLSGTAHLKRGGRNPTEGANNRARSLTVARILDKKYKKWKKCIFLHFLCLVVIIWQACALSLQRF